MGTIQVPWLDGTNRLESVLSARIGSNQLKLASIHSYLFEPSRIDSSRVGRSCTNRYESALESAGIDSYLLELFSQLGMAQIVEMGGIDSDARPVGTNRVKLA